MVLRLSLLGLPVCLFFVLGCGADEGGRCQINSDCASGLVCFQGDTGNGVCRPASTPPTTNDAASTPDATVEVDTAVATDTAPISSVDVAAISMIDSAPVSSLDVAAISTIDSAPVSSLDVAAISTIDSAPVSSLDVAAISTIDSASVSSLDGAPVSAIDAEEDVASTAALDGAVAIDGL